MIYSAQSSSQNENFVNTSRNLLRNRNQTFSLASYFTWKLDLVSNILWIIVGSKESVGVKFKEGISAKLCLKLWFESAWYFCNISK